MSTLIGIYLLTGIGFIALAIPLVMRWVKPNWIYGFRMPRTMNNPELWYPANAYFGRWMVGIGLFEVIAAIVFLTIPGIAASVYASLIGGFLMAGLILAVTFTWRYINNLEK